MYTGGDRSGPFLGFLACLLVLLCVGCQAWSQRGAQGVGLLSKASPEEKNFSGAKPQNPYSQLSPGILTRTLYQTPTGRGYRIEVRDLLVGPRQRAQGVSLPGAVIVEVRSGSGVMTIGEKRQDLAVGSTFSLAEGAAFAIESRPDTPIAMRVYVFVAE